MNEDLVCRIPASFVAEVGKCVMNEEGNCRKRRDCLMVKTVECHTGELDSVPAYAPELLCDAGQVA